MVKFYDLSHKIENGMTYFPGDPIPQIQTAQEVQPPWKVSEIRLGSHSGTHIDAPSHYIMGGKTIDQYPLNRFIRKGVVTPLINLANEEPIQPQHLSESINLIPRGGAILIRTDWDKFWNTEHYLSHPYLSSAAVEAIASSGIGIVGIDTLNIDSTIKGNDHAHHILLNQDILIIENLTGLSQLKPNFIYRFFFIPLPFIGLDGSPIRAFAKEETG